MKIFKWDNPFIKYVVVAFVLAFFYFLFANEAKGLELEAGAGVTVGDLSGTQLATELTILTDNGKWEASVGHLETDWNDISYLGAARIVRVLERGETPFLFLGAAYAKSSGPEVFLSTRWNFLLGAGVEYKKFRAEYKHISNAGTSLPNRGLNFILLNWRF